jgi:hypothetical protein
MTFRKPSLWQRISKRSSRELFLLVEAGIMVSLAALMLSTRPFRDIAADARRKAATGKATATSAAEIGWAVRAIADRAPFRAVCFQRGLAAHWMLRRRGLDSVMFFGAASLESKGLSAHVWVTSEGKGVVGAETADQFAVLARFPELASGSAESAPPATRLV